MKHGLRTGSKLWPGEPGTERHERTYGEKLVCVRYLYDSVRQLRFTTVEIVVDQGPWKPRAARDPEAIVPVRVAASEVSLRTQVKAAGGVWNPQMKVWFLPQRTVSDLGLQERVVPRQSLVSGSRSGQAVFPKKVPTNG